VGGTHHKSENDSSWETGQRKPGETPVLALSEEEPHTENQHDRSDDSL
jgi:hypothetical protein